MVTGGRKDTAKKQTRDRVRKLRRKIKETLDSIEGPYYSIPTNKPSLQGFKKDKHKELAKLVDGIKLVKSKSGLQTIKCICKRDLRICFVKPEFIFNVDVRDGRDKICKRYSRDKKRRCDCMRNDCYFLTALFNVLNTQKQYFYNRVNQTRKCKDKTYSIIHFLSLENAKIAISDDLTPQPFAKAKSFIETLLCSSNFSSKDKKHYWRLINQKTLLQQMKNPMPHFLNTSKKSDAQTLVEKQLDVLPYIYKNECKKLEKEKKGMVDMIDNLRKENEDLLRKIEELRKINKHLRANKQCFEKETINQYPSDIIFMNVRDIIRFLNFEYHECSKCGRHRGGKWQIHKKHQFASHPGYYEFKYKCACSQKLYHLKSCATFDMFYNDGSQISRPLLPVLFAISSILSGCIYSKYSKNLQLLGSSPYSDHTFKSIQLFVYEYLGKVSADNLKFGTRLAIANVLDTVSGTKNQDCPKIKVVTDAFYQLRGHFSPHCAGTLICINDDKIYGDSIDAILTASHVSKKSDKYYKKAAFTGSSKAMEKAVDDELFRMLENGIIQACKDGLIDEKTKYILGENLIGGNDCDGSASKSMLSVFPNATKCFEKQHLAKIGRAAVQHAMDYRYRCSCERLVSKTNRVIKRGGREMTTCQQFNKYHKGVIQAALNAKLQESINPEEMKRHYQSLLKHIQGICTPEDTCSHKFPHKHRNAISCPTQIKEFRQYMDNNFISKLDDVIIDGGTLNSNTNESTGAIAQRFRSKFTAIGPMLDKLYATYMVVCIKQQYLREGYMNRNITEQCGDHVQNVLKHYRKDKKYHFLIDFFNRTGLPMRKITKDLLLHDSYEKFEMRRSDRTIEKKKKRANWKKRKRKLERKTSKSYKKTNVTGIYKDKIKKGDFRFPQDLHQDSTSANADRLKELKLTIKMMICVFSMNSVDIRKIQLKHKNLSMKGKGMTCKWRQIFNSWLDSMNGKLLNVPSDIFERKPQKKRRKVKYVEPNEVFSIPWNNTDKVCVNFSNTDFEVRIAFDLETGSKNAYIANLLELGSIATLWINPFRMQHATAFQGRPLGTFETYVKSQSWFPKSAVAIHGILEGARWNSPVREAPTPHDISMQWMKWIREMKTKAFKLLKEENALRTLKSINNIPVSLEHWNGDRYDVPVLAYRFAEASGARESFLQMCKDVNLVASRDIHLISKKKTGLAKPNGGWSNKSFHDTYAPGNEYTHHRSIGDVSMMLDSIKKCVPLRNAVNNCKSDLCRSLPNLLQEKFKLADEYANGKGCGFSFEFVPRCVTHKFPCTVKVTQKDNENNNGGRLYCCCNNDHMNHGAFIDGKFIGDRRCNYYKFLDILATELLKDEILPPSRKGFHPRCSYNSFENMIRKCVTPNVAQGNIDRRITLGDLLCHHIDLNTLFNADHFKNCTNSCDGHTFVLCLYKLRQLKHIAKLVIEGNWTPTKEHQGKPANYDGYIKLSQAYKVLETVELREEVQYDNMPWVSTIF